MAQPLNVVIGKDEAGKYYFFDITQAPHMIVAGTTGSGKSVFLNALLVQLIAKSNDTKLNVYVGDPKRVEFAEYKFSPMVKRIANTPAEHEVMLKELVDIMENRFNWMSERSLKDLRDYPFVSNIVVVIDEFGDLVMDKNCGSRIMDLVKRLTQMGRAAAITCILATQRPTTKVIDGIIKANCPFVVAFKVANAVDSRVIMGTKGAEALKGKGDMYMNNANESAPIRLQGEFFDDDNIKQVIYSTYYNSREYLMKKGGV